MPRGRDGLRPQGHWRAGRDVCGVLEVLLNYFDRHAPAR